MSPYLIPVLTIICCKPGVSYILWHQIQYPDKMHAACVERELGALSYLSIKIHRSAILSLGPNKVLKRNICKFSDRCMPSLYMFLIYFIWHLIWTCKCLIIDLWKCPAHNFRSDTFILWQTGDASGFEFFLVLKNIVYPSFVLN